MGISEIVHILILRGLNGCVTLIIKNKQDTNGIHQNTQVTISTHFKNGRQHFSISGSTFGDIYKFLKAFRYCGRVQVCPRTINNNESMFS